MKNKKIIKFLQTVDNPIFCNIVFGCFLCLLGASILPREGSSAGEVSRGCDIVVDSAGLRFAVPQVANGGSGVARHWPFWGPWKNNVFEQHTIQRQHEILKNHQILAVKPPSWPAQGLLQRLFLSLWERSVVVLCREAFSGCVLGCIALFCSFF